MNRLGRNAKDELRKYLDELRKFNQEEKVKNLVGDKVKSKLFDKFLQHGKDNLRTYFDLLRKMNNEYNDRSGLRKDKGEDLARRLLNG